MHAAVTLKRVATKALPWTYRARVVDQHSIAVLAWCWDQYGNPGLGERWDYYSADSVTIFIRDEDDAFAMRMRWT